jgi:tetratricopeptide (TPR) repeat protein
MRILLFLLVISSTLRAQENDSLFSRIMVIKNDTERVNRLYKRGYDLRNQNPQWAFEYGKRTENEALKTHSEKHIAKSYNLLGIMFYKKGNYKNALRYHKQALLLRKKNKDTLGMAFSQTNLGNVYSGMSLFGEAEEFYLSAIRNYESLGDKKRIADCLLNIGGMNYVQKKYDEAIENFKLAAEITPMNDYDAKAIYFTNMAAAFIKKGLAEKSIAYSEDALKLRIMVDNNLETADNYLNLGDAYLQLKDFKKAKHYIDTASFIAERDEYFELRREAAETFSRYYYDIKNFEQAYNWLKKYQTLGDSIRSLQEEEKQEFYFDEEVNYSNDQEQSLQNIWLLVTVFALVIFIPFYLIRFKR